MFKVNNRIVNISSTNFIILSHILDINFQIYLDIKILIRFHVVLNINHLTRNKSYKENIII